MTAGVIGATGYAGAELVRLLSGHTEINNFVLSSVSFEGERMEDVYPNLLGAVHASLVKSEEVARSADVVFSALPAGVGEDYARICLERGIPFIDLSADFRFDDEATYAAWYGKNWAHADLHKYSVYGLPELNRQRIRDLAAAGKVIIGNPGCYPTGATLGIYPALARGLAGPGTIIVDSASGVTGGGREPTRSFHYPECADSFAPYKIGGSHRHTPEIARNVCEIASRGGHTPPPVIFTPHLAPMNRGILSTIYIPLAHGLHAAVPPAFMPPSKEVAEKTAEIRALYSDFYKGESFVRVLPEGVIAATNRVRQSNYCDISIHLDQSGSTLIIASAIDNMVKGAAGQAIQNMNIVFGFDERTGLEAVPALF